jgi:hypothetical protein
MNRGRRPDSPFKRWVKGRSGPVPFEGGALGVPDREILDLLGDPENPLCWLDKLYWVRVLAKVKDAERGRKRRLSRPVYEELVRSLAPSIPRSRLAG